MKDSLTVFSNLETFDAISSFNHDYFSFMCHSTTWAKPPNYSGPQNFEALQALVSRKIKSDPLSTQKTSQYDQML